jgi:hypothetical protein
MKPLPPLEYTPASIAPLIDHSLRGISAVGTVLRLASLHFYWANRLAGESGCKLPASPAPVVCVMPSMHFVPGTLVVACLPSLLVAPLLLGVAAVEQEDHAYRKCALLLDERTEIRESEERIPCHISPVLEPGKQVGRQSSLVRGCEFLDMGVLRIRKITVPNAREVVAVVKIFVPCRKIVVGIGGILK